ncbi:hypothetical protein LCGC14_0369600 [marine sediment metagenome]|uniref:Uncharacterized protein n=1 Tax=marine sediment metagenome TaxID=412755 RepID=A0A0F9VSL7_9ZZZZ
MGHGKAKTKKKVDKGKITGIKKGRKSRREKK